MTTEETLDLALEALEVEQTEVTMFNLVPKPHITKAITAIKQARSAPVQEPIGYLFQHEETGLTTFVDVQQVEWGFEKNNPRHQKIGPVYTTPPAAKRQWVGLDWLPEHKCGLHLSHNEHRDVYEPVEQFYDADDFTSEEEWHKAVAEDSVWVLHWYPNTPIGFTRIAASTLEAIEAKLKEKNT
jgi:hypothetical protein